MPIELTPDVTVRRDSDGRIRQLQHLDQPYRPDRLGPSMLAGIASSPSSPRALAEAYLRDTAELYDFAPAATANFAANLASAPTEAPVELRFKEEKATGEAVTIAYDQTVLGLPIWGAGMTVRIDGGQMNVTGSHNASHYDVDVQAPSPEAQYVPHAMAPDVLARLLGLADRAGLTVNSTRSVVYKYDAADRIDDQVAAHDEATEITGIAGAETPSLPSLRLEPVPDTIEQDRHYVVTEVLFTRACEGWGPLNWRAFIEPESGTILYLRALVACAHGAVFPSDPVTLTGIQHSAADPVTSLDPLRKAVPLLGLKTPTSLPASQPLEGEYVRLVEIEAPMTRLPQELDPFAFDYPCNTDNFAACSAYHHCDGFFRMLHGMGLDPTSYFNDTDFPVPVDPHAFNGEVNAAAPGNNAGNGLGKLVFGLARAGSTFGIAADVRVVIHEFGHAVLWDHVGFPNFGWAHSPGDALAAILHDPDTKATDRFETFPFMKNSAGLSRRHDRDVARGWAWGGRFDDRQYGSEQILSTVLFRVYLSAGGESTNLANRQFASRFVAYLILKAVGMLSFTTRDPDVFVGALTEADATTSLFESHPGGAFGKIFRWSFEQQGLYQAPGAPRPVTRPGEQPAVDVFIDDGRGGSYMPYLEDSFGEADIWNRRAADGGPANEDPQVGVTNYAYVRVTNRGTTPAVEVAVRGFKSKIAAAAIWPTDWSSTSTARLTADDPIPPGGSAIVGPFAWIPQFDGERLLFEVSAPGDRSTLEKVTAGPIPNARLVPLDNNLAQRLF
jgi:hypothetical protein